MQDVDDVVPRLLRGVSRRKAIGTGVGRHYSFELPKLAARDISRLHDVIRDSAFLFFSQIH